jgi:putative dehydrogenase
MDQIVAVVAPGMMGSAVAGRLRARGAVVWGCLDGRGEASRVRAEAAGMVSVPFADLARADFVLSIVPPGEAIGFATAMVPHLTAVERKPVFVDCNAVSPQTVQAIAGLIAPTGCAFVDAGIIGGPPAEGYDGPTFYASGPDATRFAELAEHGLVVRVLDGPVGAASGLKMSYGGITKGVTALAAAMMLAATRFGAADALQAELAHSLRPLLSWFERQVPGMYPKAYRWVAEMQEIEAFLAEDPAAAQMFAGAAALYERLAADQAGERVEIDQLTAFLKKS